MNVNTYTCTFINGVAFDDELVYNQTVRILNSIEKASPFKVIPTTELIKAFRNYPVELMIGKPFELMLDADQKIIIASLLPILYAAIEMGLINQDAQDALIGVL